MLANHVLFLDGEALVIDKPAGLPVDRPRDGSISLENHLAGLTFGFRRWPHAVHRLDRDTSGLMVVARTAEAHRERAQAQVDIGLAAQPRQRRLQLVEQGGADINDSVEASSGHRPQLED